MRDQNTAVDWNLLLIGSSRKGPESMLSLLAGGVAACGGWVLHQGRSGQTCAEIDFEFPRANCVEVYSVLVATGVTLSQEAHLQLTELCLCTKHMLATRAFHIVRLQLTVFTEVELFVEIEDEAGEADEAETRAA